MHMKLISGRFITYQAFYVRDSRADNNGRVWSGTEQGVGEKLQNLKKGKRRQWQVAVAL